LPWNTGWAKLAELIEAYHAYDVSTNRQINIGIAKGGALEVVHSRTALVVSKQWMLVLGLLGRYGIRTDKGILHMTGVRREFDDEKASIRHF
jgi:hypothetical protein